MSDAWIATGDQANWERGLEQGIWGVVPSLENEWKKLKAGDLVFFYVKEPIGRVVGFGTVRTKFKQTEPLWKEELAEKRTIWPFRFEFDVGLCLPISEWNTEGVEPRPFHLPILAGLNHMRSFEVAERLITLLKQTEMGTLVSGKVPLLVKESTGTYEAAKQPSLHDELQSQLVEIGRAQRMFADPEFPIEGGRLDVVWRRVLKSVPTYVFEVHISGEINSALAKLKYAYQLWNSKVFLIAEEDQNSRTETLVQGPFHELNGVLKQLSPFDVHELYDLKSRLSQFEHRLGIL